MTDHEIFELGDLALQRGGTLPGARLAYATYGVPGRAAILFPTWFAGTHEANEWLIGPGRALDTDRYFVIAPNLFGNGLSSSPSNTPPPFDRARFPQVTMADNVAAQYRLVTEHLGVDRLALVLGASMGAGQAYQWAVGHPEMVERLASITGSSHTSPHNQVFLEGLRAALTADSAYAGGDYTEQPRAGLRAFSRVYAGWGLSQAFYWERVHERLGFATLEDFITGVWEANFAGWDANDLLAMMWTWQHADVGRTPGFDGDTVAALASVKARALLLPSRKDLYFPPEDEEWSARHLPDAEVRVIPGIWGHLAGGGADPEAAAFVDAALRDLLATG
ncbi:alpha/beta fold hydrolase [Actinoallomurus iriomotensis]|uniref:Homoserine O-acetyltransferase n=1 Tax=Actinoallomurus iriomotensis TaxID=478107 RepID=A0A9W6VQF8_9ACTN|nr:alpha/beta fold hydrolase [Actinoallomurus iriomotensis]GLY75427.1 homoserine O-acetyltransferase [Actinoallomurus iriomotensis]